jgi:hypothetical protein
VVNEEAVAVLYQVEECTFDCLVQKKDCFHATIPRTLFRKLKVL